MWSSWIEAPCHKSGQRNWFSVGTVVFGLKINFFNSKVRIEDTIFPSRHLYHCKAMDFLFNYPAVYVRKVIWGNDYDRRNSRRNGICCDIIVLNGVVAPRVSKCTQLFHMRILLPKITNSTPDRMQGDLIIRKFIKGEGYTPPLRPFPRDSGQKACPPSAKSWVRNWGFIFRKPEEGHLWWY